VEAVAETLMRLPKPRDWLLPLMILAFVGLSVTFLSPVFNTTTRWVILGVVALYLLFKGSLWRPIRTHFGLFTLILALWIVATVIWSEVPLLSGMKAGAFLVIAFTCMAAGQFWVRQHAPQDALNYLLPLTVVALLAGVLGRYSAQAVSISGSTTMYQGLVSGSNMFGSMLAMCSPFLLWQTYRYWRNMQRRVFWLALSGIGLFYLFAASSRGAILVVLFTLLGLFLSLGGNRKAHFSIMAIGLALTVFMLAPGQYERFERQYIYKLGTEEQGVLHTREEVWQKSYELARKGGWFGGGYGVTIGETVNANFQGGFTSVGFGREKGNSQLAIAEETGLVGLGIYLASLYVLFARLGKSVMRRPRSPEKLLLSMVTGTLFGMLVGSVFEAWWVAPSSPESVYFWTLAGVALGLARLKPEPAKLVPQERKPFGGRMVPRRHGRSSVST
jgi:O-antigen ligase